MALEGQTINFPLVKGLDTKVDSKQIPMGEFSLLENVIFKTIQKFRKRNGYTATATDVITSTFSFTFQKLASTITNGSWCAAFKNEKVMSDGFGLYSFSDAAAKWEYKGRCESARVQLSKIYQSSNTYPPGGSLINTVNTQYNPDSAINTTSGFSLYSWESYISPPSLLGTCVGAQYALVDTATGNMLFNAIVSSTTSRPRCVAVSSFQYLFYFDSNDNKLKARSITSTGAGSATDIATDINQTTPNYDVVVDSTTIYVTYYVQGGGITTKSFSSALAAIGSRTLAAENATNGICVFNGNNSDVWVGYSNGTNTKYFVLNAALSATLLGATSLDGGGGVQNVIGVFDTANTRGVFFYDNPSTPYIYNKTGILTDAGYNQPAVGSSVTVNTTGDVTDYVGQTIYIDVGGYYYLSSATATSITIVNLGYTGNAAPAAAVATAKAIYPSSGHYSGSLVRYNTGTDGATVGSAGIVSYSMAICSRAFLYGGVAHFIGCYDSATQPTLFLCSLFNVNTSAVKTPPAHYVARIASNFAGGIPSKSVVSSVNLISSGNYQSAVTTRFQSIEKTVSSVSYAAFLNGISSVSIDLAPTQVPKVELGNNLHIGSGSLMMYDGVSSVEHGFHTFPEPVSLSDSGSGRIPNGTYSYCAVYAWQDAQGQTHRSAPSQIASITTTGGNSAVIVSVTSLAITQKNDVTIEIYRTLISGSVFYRVDSNYFGTLAYPIRNSPGSVVTFTDVYGDDEIIGNQQLYTTGEVENICSPAPHALSTFKSRLQVVSADDTTTEWYSKQVIPGSPVELSDFLVQNTDQAGSGIVGSTQLDDKWIIFKGTNVFYVVGSGPAASGANNDFSDPTLIATDVGLVDRASIVVMPLGVMFKTSKGIYLLDRSLAVQYIGAMVESYNSYTVVAARLAASVNQVRFLISNGQALVYDYFVNQWSVFTNHSAVDAMISNGVFYHLRSTGVLYKETDGVYSDNGSFISMKMRTSWLQFAGVQGFQRLWQIILLGEYISAHQLQVEMAVDFDSTVAETKTFTPTALLDYQWQFNPSIQKCESMQLTIQDVYTDTIGESYSLSNLAFYVGVKKGLNKMAATQS